MSQQQRSAVRHSGEHGDDIDAERSLKDTDDVMRQAREKTSHDFSMMHQAVPKSRYVNKSSLNRTEILNDLLLRTQQRQSQAARDSHKIRKPSVNNANFREVRNLESDVSLQR